MKLISLLYKRIFHEEVSDEIKSFLSRLSYVGLGTIINTLIAFPFSILVGRTLGPDEYGKFGLVLSVAMFLNIPMLLGFATAMVKYTAESDDFDRQSRIISTTYILVFLFSVVSVGLYFVFSYQLSGIFSITQESFYLSVILAFLLMSYNLSTNTLMALHKMRAFAMIQPVFGITLLPSLLIFIFYGLTSFKSAVYSYCLAHGVPSVLILILIRKHVKFQLDWYWASLLTKYSLFAGISGISFVVVTNIDKLLINKYASVSSVGIYLAYYMASMTIPEYLFRIFHSVFFPTISKYEDKDKIYRKINKSIPYLSGLGFLFIFLCEFIILKLYGSKYPLDPLWMILFVVASICLFISHIYAWLLISVGVHGARINAFSTVFIALINTGLNIIFIPFIGIIGAIVSRIVGSIVYTTTNLIMGRNLFRGRICNRTHGVGEHLTN
jgi:O-antigen/teichoic acid export membrane protein